MRKINLFVILCILLQMFAFSVSAQESTNAAFYVAPNGSDANKGTIDSPFATMDAARQAVNNIKGQASGDITVYFRGGTYKVNKTTSFTSEDSGKDGVRIIYAAYPDEKPVFDAGVDVKKWKPYKDGIYRAKVNGVEDFREFYVNDARQQRARTKPLQGFGFDENKEYIKVLTSDLPADIKNQSDTQVFNNWNWRVHYTTIEKLIQDDPYTKIYFKKPYITKYLYNGYLSSLEFKTWLCIENALAFLDEDGEWFYDKYEQYVYYKPAKGVDMSSINAVAPRLEKIIDIKGTDASKRINNLTFKGFTFSYPGWIFTNAQGFASTQTTEMTTMEGLKMTPGCIMTNYADNITIEDNTFTHTGANAITMEDGIANINIKGNIFYDIGAAAVSIGSTRHGGNVGENVPKNIITSNNVLRNTAMEYWGAAAITYFFTYDSSILHNDIRGTSYSGISVGWGWSKEVYNSKNNIVGYNRISNYTRKVNDGGAIYSLSTNPGSSYRGNYIKDTNMGSALYHDENSGGFDDYDNVIEMDNLSGGAFNFNHINNELMHNIYTNSAGGINYNPEENVVIKDITIIPDAKWPKEAQDIIDNAGLEKNYQYLLDTVKGMVAPSAKRPILRSPGFGIDMAPDPITQLFTPIDYEPAYDKEYSEAPFLEEKGSVLVEGGQYNPNYYIGFEKCQNAWFDIGGDWARSWAGNFVSTEALFTYPVQIQRDAKKFTEKPRVGYDLKFTTPGDYYIFVRGNSGKAGDDKLQLFWDDKDIGKLGFTNKFRFENIGKGKPIKVSVKEPGIHKLTVDAIDEKDRLFIDRIWITKNIEDVSHGSEVSGPLPSKKEGNFEYLDIPKPLQKNEFPIDKSTRINYAFKKTAYSSENFSDAFLPSRATDGDVSSEWIPQYSNNQHWWKVDLQKPIAITELEVRFRLIGEDPNARKNFQVQASNDIDFKTYDVIATHSSEITPFAEGWVVTVNNPKKFQYVRLIKTVSGEFFGLGEVKIYSDKLDLISEGKNVTSSVEQSGEFGSNNINDNKLNTLWSAAKKENYWTQIDLETPSKINRIDVDSRNDVDLSASRRNFKILASNDPEFKEFEVIAEQGDMPFEYKTTWSKSLKSAIPYRYIRYVKDGDYVAVAEFKVYSIIDRSAYARISSFKVDGQIGKAIVDTEKGIINVDVDDKTDMKTITPLVELSKEARIEPELGKPVDFSKGEATYKIIQQNGKTDLWTVYINKREPLSKPLELSDFSGWTGATQTSGAGLTIKKDNSKYTAKKFDNELLSFNLKYKFAGNDWPCIVLRSQSTDKDILNGDTAYVVCIKNDVWELQKWVSGKREMLIGTFESQVPRWGILNNMEFLSDVENNIKVGAINEKDGVRLVLFCNGQRVFDVIDSNNPITQPGYLELLAYTGPITISTPIMPEFAQKLNGSVAIMVGNSSAIANNMRSTIVESDEKIVPVIENERTFVPLRFVAENLGAKVEWDNATSEAKILRKDGIIIRIAIGKESYYIGDKEIALNTPAKIINDRTYIPLRTVAEALDKNVFWDDRGLILISEKMVDLDAIADKTAIDGIIELFKK